MLGYLADKALICGLISSAAWCLSLCLVSMAMGSCCQHIGRFALKNKSFTDVDEKLTNV